LLEAREPNSEAARGRGREANDDVHSLQQESGFKFKSAGRHGFWQSQKFTTATLEVVFTLT
jgi:hypothetical protein